MKPVSVFAHTVFQILGNCRDVSYCIKNTAFLRNPVLNCHKAVWCPRLSSLVLAVVTATERKKSLDWRNLTNSSFFLLKYPQQTSGEVALFSGEKSRCQVRLKAQCIPTYCYHSTLLLFEFIYKCILNLVHLQGPQNANPHVYLSAWLTSSAACRFLGCAATEEGSPQRASLLGRHENTESENRATLLPFQHCCSSVCKVLCIALRESHLSTEINQLLQEQMR